MRQIQVPEKGDFVVITQRVRPKYLAGAVVKVEAVNIYGEVTGIIDHIPNPRGGRTNWRAGGRIRLQSSLIDRVVQAA